MFLKKNSFFSFFVGLYLIISLALPAYAITSTIQVTHTPYLSFVQVPESFQIPESGPFPVQILDNTIPTNYSDVLLPEKRYLTVQDTRGCGGFNLQVTASAFQPAPTPPNPSLNDGLRILTSTYDAQTGTEENGVKYYAAEEETYTGEKGIIAPLNTASTDFNNTAIFSAPPFDNGSNIMLTDTPVDIMQGELAAPLGRDGIMHLATTFALKIPKFYAPDDYYTTLTFTLTDATTGTCT